MRADFDAHAQETYDLELRFLHEYPEHCASTGRTLNKLLSIDDAGFTASMTGPIKYGYVRLPNPRISEQPWHILSPYRIGGMTEGQGGGWLAEGEMREVDAPEGTVAVVLDLSRPWSDQVDSVREWFQYSQKKHHGRVIQNRKFKDDRRRAELWLSYLRVLDGREAGATWRQIFDAILRSQKPNNPNPEQEARGVWLRAQELMFNWRY